jgi:SSS family solute:Na+ symporter
LWKDVAANRPDMLTLPGPKGFFTPGMWFGMSLMLSFGIIIQPHMIIRYYTAVSEKTLKWLGATTPIYLMTIYIPAALVGLGGAVAMPGLAVADRIFPELLFAHAPAWLTGLVLAGAAAAAMSTLVSILHANMTVLTRDVYERYVAPGRSERHYVTAGRVIVLALLGVGYVLSVTSVEFIVVLVALSGAGAMQLFPALLGVCFPTRRLLTRAGVLAGIGAGLLMLYATLIVFPHPLGMHGGVWSVLVNVIVTLVVSRLTNPPSPATVLRVHGELERFVYGAKG